MPSTSSIFGYSKRWEREFRDVKIYLALGHLTDAHRTFQPFKRNSAIGAKLCKGLCKG